MFALREWIVEQALPLWSTQGFDRAQGCFHERLDFDGRAVDVPYRTMVQARQIYVFAKAAGLGWSQDGLEKAEIAMARLLRCNADTANGMTSFAFSTGRTGQVVSDLRDAYGHAFVLLALAWLHRANGDPSLLDIADRTIAFIDQKLIDPEHGGLFDSFPAISVGKRQNPVMHLLESYLALEQAAPGRGYLARASALVDLFSLKMFQPEGGLLPEYFTRHWSHDREFGSIVVEPGHLFEWAWLLDRHAEMVGAADARHAAVLRSRAIAFGLAPSGMIWDEIDDNGLPRQRGHRLWPHCEALKATALAGSRGDADAARLAEDMSTILLRHFVGCPLPGAWIDRVDEDGRPVSADIPASSLYHLLMAAAELETIETTAGFARVGAPA